MIIFITPLTLRKKTKLPSCSNTLNCESLLNPIDAPFNLNPAKPPPAPACASARTALVFSKASTTSNKSLKKSTSNKSISLLI